MAGENDLPQVNPLPEDVTQNYLNNANAMKTAFDVLTTSVGKLSSGIDLLLNKFGTTSSATAKQIDLTQVAADGFKMFSQNVIGASTAMDAFAAKGSQMQTFSQQLQGLGTASNFAIGALTKIAAAAGMQGAFSAGAGAVKAYVGTVAASADSALNLQNGILQMAGATGNLGKVYQEAGGSLGNLNQVIMKQRVLMDDVAQATGASTSQVAGFYKMLGDAIPGATSKEISSTDNAGRSFNNLRAVMTLASGTGREVQSVITDLTTAWETYGLEGEEALEFTARMSELSNKFGINLSYTEGFMKKNAEAFKMISDNADNAAMAFNRMFEPLRQTGLSAKESSDLIGRMTTQMSNLSIAQKAFISARTGGPGGLRGALGIEQMLRDGDVSGVMEKVQSALKQQFGGKIYSMQEAQQSDFAAAQFVKQRELLKSDAFGKLAGNDAEATRILEAFKSGTKPTEALQDGRSLMNNTLSQGQDVQERSYTVLTKILNAIERQRGADSFRNLEALQRYGTGATFMDTQSGRLRTGAGADELRNTRMLGDQAAVNTGFAVRGQQNFDAKSYIDNAQKTLFSSIPASIKPVFDEIKKGLSSSDSTVQKATMDKFNAEMAKLNEQEKMIKSTTLPNQNELLADVQQKKSYLNLAALQQPTAANVANAQTTAAAAPAPTHHAPPPPQKLDVTFRGMCVSCSRPIHPDPHLQANSGGAIKR